MTTNPNTIADAYLAIWNETDADRRRSLLADSWAQDASYVDPLMRGNGRGEIATMIEAARGQFPGHVFSPRGVADGHGDYARFSWALTSPEGAPVAGGTDVVKLDADGRITQVIGFLDGPPA